MQTLEPTMSKAVEYDVAPETQLSEYEQIAAQMKKRDEELRHRLRQMRIIVRILDLGFGFVLWRAILM